ncbi:PH domain-containing protein [Allonocardiopsis opalescens]|nr:PH domain-containing protein [Allonocardiopsis opalescens]
MAIRDRDLAEDEEILRTIRQHWTTLVAEFVLLLLVAAVAGVLLWLLPYGQPWALPAMWVILALAAVAACWLWLLPMLSWWSTVYVLTNRRLVKRYGIIVRNGRDIPLTRVNDVAFSAHLLDRLLGHGTLVVSSASENSGMVLKHVPDVEHVQSLIYQAVDEEQQRYRQGEAPPPARP